MFFVRICSIFRFWVSFCFLYGSYWLRSISDAILSAASFDSLSLCSRLSVFVLFLGSMFSIISSVRSKSHPVKSRGVGGHCGCWVIFILSLLLFFW